MAEDNKVNHNVDPTTFAQPVPEKTELERLQERIANFKVSVSPTVAQLAQVLMNQSLQNPTKPEDLDGYVQVRNELKLGSMKKKRSTTTEDLNQDQDINSLVYDLMEESGTISNISEHPENKESDGEVHSKDARSPTKSNFAQATEEKPTPRNSDKYDVDQGIA